MLDAELLNVDGNETLFGSYVRYRYLEHKGWRYCWTMQRQANGTHAAFIYKPGTIGHSLAKYVEYSSRKSAKNRAGYWWLDAQRNASGRPSSRVMNAVR